MPGMLVLSRKRAEGVTVRMPDGREIKVTVEDIRGDKVRLGFSADPDVVIHRDEILEKIRRQNTNDTEKRIA